MKKTLSIAFVLLLSALILSAEGAAELQTEQVGLTAQEKEDLLYMYEEERLARDIYTALAGQWNVPIFSNIAASEQTHMNAVELLISAYDLELPESSESGGYAFEELELLYRDLVLQGSISLEQALAVGAAIEELDIADLEERMERTDKEDILITYERLHRGSINHLRAFTRTS
jgi:hypothetical protein